MDEADYPANETSDLDEEAVDVSEVELSAEDDVEDADLIEADELSPDDLDDTVLYTLDWSVQSLLERIGSTFDVNPSFQRRDAWTAERKSLYIESLMLGLPVPQVVLAEDRQTKGRFIVLDGKQRLVTLKQFAAPSERYPQFRLRKLDFLPEMEGMTFADVQASVLYSAYAESFLSQPVRTIVVRNWGKESVLYHIFVRLNQASVSLSPQELRQALFPGPFSNFINEASAGSSAIHRARRIKREDFRMRDAEMLLRFIAFEERIEHYRGNLRAFLDDMANEGTTHWNQRQPRYMGHLRSCERAIDLTFQIFGPKRAFLRFHAGRYVRRFNIAVFDAMTLVLADPALDGVDLAAHTEDLRRAYEELCSGDEQFQASLTTTTKTIPATLGRIAKWGAAVGSVIGTRPRISERAEAALNAYETGNVI